MRARLPWFSLQFVFFISLLLLFGRSLSTPRLCRGGLFICISQAPFKLAPGVCASLVPIPGNAYECKGNQCKVRETVINEKRKGRSRCFTESQSLVNRKQETTVKRRSPLMLHWEGAPFGTHCSGFSFLTLTTIATSAKSLSFLAFPLLVLNIYIWLLFDWSVVFVSQLNTDKALCVCCLASQVRADLSIDSHLKPTVSSFASSLSMVWLRHRRQLK